MLNQPPLPGHAIPYAYSFSEIQDFLNQFSRDPSVSDYLYTKQPPYGIIFNLPGDYGQLLLWFDDSGVFHVIDVTNMSIAVEVQKAPYESPDGSVIDNLIQQINALIASLPSPSQALTTALEAIAAVTALYLLFRIAR